MKKLALYNSLSLIFLLAYVALLLANRFIPLTKLPMRDFWFPVLCMVIGAALAARAIIFKSDSATWFSLYLIINGLILFLSFYLPFTFFQMWPVLFSSAAISSFFVGVFFKDKFHLKIFAYLALFSLTFFLFSFKIINVVWFVVMLAVMVLAVVAEKLIPTILYSKNGEK